MTINEYQKAAYRTANQSLTDSQQLQNGLMGLNGESGECIDILKKHLFQGHDLDKYHIAKELGDVAWYLAVSAQALGFDLETILQMNVEKLKARYPYGFDAGHSQLGALSILIENDATAFIFFCLIGVPLFFAKENWIMDGGGSDYVYEESRRESVRSASDSRREESNGYRNPQAARRVRSQTR